MPGLSSLLQLIRALFQFMGIPLTNTPHLSTFGLAFGGSFLLAGFIMMFIAAINSFRVIFAQSWPTAPGVVIGSTIASSHSSEGGTSYRPVISYQYQVGERTYQNNR